MVPARLRDRIDLLDRVQTRAVAGRVAAVQDARVLVRGLAAPVGTTVRIDRRLGAAVGAGERAHGEVVGFEGGASIVMLFGEPRGIAPGDAAVADGARGLVPAGSALLGRVVDAFGQPIDGGPPLAQVSMRPLYAPHLDALSRRPIVEPLPTGLRVIDGLLTLGRGQRIGLFAGPGVGKTTLMGLMTREAAVDVVVVAMIGERGREVREFVEHTLGPSGLERSVVVVSTGDEPPVIRTRAALAATAIAEGFRDEGLSVLLVMDSLTRFAHAQRQVGLAAGEQPTTRGYTPSVFGQLQGLLERAGSIEGSGSITGIYTVLVEGDDFMEPVSDAVRGVLDGHVSLSRRLAARGHHPAVDVLDSVSRLADQVSGDAQIEDRRVITGLLAAYAEPEEVISLGAQVRGANPLIDVAIDLKPAIDEFCRQGRRESVPFDETRSRLSDLAREARERLAEAGRPRTAAAAAPATTTVTEEPRA